MQPQIQSLLQTAEECPPKCGIPDSLNDKGRTLPRKPELPVPIQISVQSCSVQIPGIKIPQKRGHDQRYNAHRQQAPRDLLTDSHLWDKLPSNGKYHKGSQNNPLPYARLLKPTSANMLSETDTPFSLYKQYSGIKRLNTNPYRRL